MPPRKKRRKKSKGSAYTETATDNGHAKLIRELFQAAIKLRGSVEPADYKRFVLPIIFIRFLSLRYERRRVELEALIRNPASDYHTKDKKMADRILRDPDEYHRVGAFIVPEKARWAHLLKNARADNIKLILDEALESLENKYASKLRGLLPKVFAGSNLSREDVTGLINLFAKDVFEQDHGGEDLVGRVYEYFIGEFANSEGKRGGEYFTPRSIVRTLVAMLEPKEGVVFDPCCGSGGMFVQSDDFTKHNRKLSFVGQESKDFTYRLCRMNLFIHGIDGNIQLGNSYFDDKHSTVKADYLLANPPFNDGSKGEHGWGADQIPDKDPRLSFDNNRLPLAPRNANTMWILHFLSHLKEDGTAGFVMATGELSNGETARFTVRKTLIESEYVDCIVQLSGQLFANTQIPCALWFLSKTRDGKKGFRKRTGQILFVDGRKLGSLIPGSRKQKQLSQEEVERVAEAYRTFRRTGIPEATPGFCRVATLDEVRTQNFVLTPGRYVGSQNNNDDDETYEEKLPRLLKQLEQHFSKARELEDQIRAGVMKLPHER